MMQEIRPLQSLDAVVAVPGSKSYTQRALVISALAQGLSVLRRPLLSDDTRHLIAALQAMGTHITIEDGAIAVKGTAGHLHAPTRPIALGNNGTAIRLLTTMVTLGSGVFTLTGDDRLCERPIKPLLEALRSLGVDARSRCAGFPPVIVQADGLAGGRVVLRDIESSQYVSSLLISAPYMRNGLDLELAGRIPSLPYIEMTVEAMKRFGGSVTVHSPRHYTVPGGHAYEAADYAVEGDVSSASYFFLAAMLTGGRVRVEHLHPRTLQGDIRLVDLLEELGGTVVRGEDWIELTGGSLGIGEKRFDLNDMPDMVPTLAVLAARRPGRTILTNVSHLRHKESNRLAALATELQRMGIHAREMEDGLEIEGGIPIGAAIETYNDHRIAMAFAVLGLVTPGIIIRDREVVNKSFPTFWQTLDGLYRS
jgi:3-phosphoshikimate 1-carboxyvinyltransferase